MKRTVYPDVILSFNDWQEHIRKELRKVREKIGK